MQVHLFENVVVGGKGRHPLGRATSLRRPNYSKPYAPIEGPRATGRMLEYSAREGTEETIELIDERLVAEWRE